ncbi:MAG TPA: GNAT family N-acetyltransferase [Thermoanaerobaculia bacterium]|nr:GNAT family N-acetyltransferase [Thermoanaerobaculia bacterium]
MQLRAATIDDSPAIASLAGELGYPCDAAAMRVRLEGLLRSDDDAVLVAVSGVAVVGWAHVSAVRLVESDAYAELRGLVVAQSLRSHGFGAGLLDAAEEWARSRGFARLRVRSNVTRERTHAFYLRHGYTIAKSQEVFDKTL